MTLVTSSKNSVSVLDGGSNSIYEYHGINPYHQRLLKLLLKKQLFGQAWQLLRRYTCIKLSAKRQPFVTVCCLCREAIKRDGVWITCSEDDVIKAEQRLGGCSHGHCPKCFIVVSQHISTINRRLEDED